MAQDTTTAQSADTPESVAARLDARVEEALETCASRSSIAADATGLLSNFIGCVEKGRGSALDSGDGRAARFALDLLERRDRAQTAEIASLKGRVSALTVVASQDNFRALAASARATQASLKPEIRSDYAAVMTAIGVESIADVPSLLAAERATVQTLREVLTDAGRFVRAFAEAETDEDIYASASACEERIAALTTPRLPIILAEHGYDATGLLPEGEGGR